MVVLHLLYDVESQWTRHIHIEVGVSCVHLDGTLEFLAAHAIVLATNREIVRLVVRINLL
jgi:hypothetical protein